MRLSSLHRLCAVLALAAAPSAQVTEFAFGAVLDRNGVPGSLALNQGEAYFKVDPLTGIFSLSVAARGGDVRLRDCQTQLVIATLVEEREGQWFASGQLSSIEVTALFDEQLRVEVASGALGELSIAGKLKEEKKERFELDDSCPGLSGWIAVDSPFGRVRVELSLAPALVGDVTVTLVAPSGRRLTIDGTQAEVLDVQVLDSRDVEDFLSGNFAVEATTSQGVKQVGKSKLEFVMGYASDRSSLGKVRMDLDLGDNEVDFCGEAFGMAVTGGRVADAATGQTIFDVTTSRVGEVLGQATLTPAQTQALLNNGAFLELTDGTRTIFGPVFPPQPDTVSGRGCVGSQGERLALSVDAPISMITGRSASFLIDNALPNASSMLILGNPANPRTRPLVLGPIAPECLILVSFLTAIPIAADANGQAEIVLPTPFATFFAIAEMQALALDQLANPLGATLSNKVRVPLN